MLPKVHKIGKRKLMFRSWGTVRKGVKIVAAEKRGKNPSLSAMKRDYRKK